MKRYNSDNINELTLNRTAVEVQKSFDFSVLPQDLCDESRGDLVSKGKVPAYCAPSVVDKTFFKPGLNALSQVSGESRKPIYDSLPDGSMPDYGVNVGWLRSAARDRVDIDLALAVVKETIERSQLEDKEKIEQLQKSEKQLNKLSEAIAKAKEAKEDSESSVPASE